MTKNNNQPGPLTVKNAAGVVIFNGPASEFVRLRRAGKL